MPASKSPRKAYRQRPVCNPLMHGHAEAFRTRMLAYLVKKELGIFECLDSGHDAAYHLNGILIGLCAASSAGCIDTGTMQGAAMRVIRDAMDACDRVLANGCRMTHDEALQISSACQRGAEILRRASHRALLATETELRRQFSLEDAA